MEQTVIDSATDEATREAVLEHERLVGEFRRRRRWTVGTLVVAAAIIAFAYAELTSGLIFTALTGAACLIAVGLVVLVWRCPHCACSLGLRWNPDACLECKASLRR